MTAHLGEDALLDLAYGELPSAEVPEAEAHVQSCEGCRAALAGIRGVRRAMATLPQEVPPSTAEESLLAYAAQAAKRRRAGGGGRWGRYFAVLGSVTALVVVGVVAQRVARETEGGVMAVTYRSRPSATVASAPDAVAPQEVAPAEKAPEAETAPPPEVAAAPPMASPAPGVVGGSSALAPHDKVPESKREGRVSQPAAQEPELPRAFDSAPAVNQLGTDAEANAAATKSGELADGDALRPRSELQKSHAGLSNGRGLGSAGFGVGGLGLRGAGEGMPEKKSPGQATTRDGKPAHADGVYKDALANKRPAPVEEASRAADSKADAPKEAASKEDSFERAFGGPAGPPLRKQVAEQDAPRSSSTGKALAAPLADDERQTDRPQEKNARQRENLKGQVSRNDVVAAMSRLGTTPPPARSIVTSGPAASAPSPPPAPESPRSNLDSSGGGTRVAGKTQSTSAPTRVQFLTRRLQEVQGSDREPILRELCAAQTEARAWAEAERTCDQLVLEFPASSGAKQVAERFAKARAAAKPETLRSKAKGSEKSSLTRPVRETARTLLQSRRR